MADEDFLTEADFLGYDDDVVVEQDEDEGFYGTGLIIGEDGELLLVIANGGLEDFSAYRINDTEAGSLAQMIQAVLG